MQYVAKSFGTVSKKKFKSKLKLTKVIGIPHSLFHI